MPTSTERLSQALNDNAPEFGIELRPEHVKGLSDYYQLLLKWNSKLASGSALFAGRICDASHLESLFLPHLPRNARMADIGLGAGLPLIPCS